MRVVPAVRTAPRVQEALAPRELSLPAPPRGIEVNGAQKVRVTVRYDEKSEETTSNPVQDDIWTRRVQMEVCKRGP